jgi:hypothetical protein
MKSTMASGEIFVGYGNAVCCGRRHLALAARPKCALYGGREFPVHLLKLLGRIGTNTVRGPRDVGPTL